MLCSVCKKEIPAARLEALPDTTTCVNCSSERPYRALVSGTDHHKNFDIQIVKGDDPVLEYEDERWNRVNKIRERDDS